jgi:16S rRNA (guanine527-N7)-methyltransferase
MTPEEFARLAPIHPESLNDYRTWERLLRKWNKSINLVAPSTLGDFWNRHALDSAQILPFIQTEADTIVDFGSGGGFPAMAIAFEAKQTRSGQTVHLIESVGKKANFLKTVSRETQVNAVIHAERIEDIEPLEADIITCRAFAPMERLLPLAFRHLKPSGKLVLLKGETISDELDAVGDWSFSFEKHPSQSTEGGVIVVVDNLQRS